MSERHLSVAELAAWRETGAGDRDRVIAHLAVCATCREAAADLERSRLDDAATPLRFDPAEFVPHGYRVGAATTGTASPARRWIWLAAAAAVVLAVVVPLRLATNDRSQEPTRGDRPTITLVRPVNVAVSADDVAFEWRGTGTDDRVRLTVVDLDRPDEPVLVQDIVGARYEPTAEERQRFSSGRELRWFVELRSGPAIATSPTARFRIR